MGPFFSYHLLYFMNYKDKCDKLKKILSYNVEWTFLHLA
jgi:hypothetical protein